MENAKTIRVMGYDVTLTASDIYIHDEETATLDFINWLQILIRHEADRLQEKVPDYATALYNCAHDLHEVCEENHLYDNLPSRKGGKIE